MTNREIIAQYDEEALVLSEDYLDEAIIGVSVDGNVVYDYDKLVEIYVKHDGMTYEDAVDWIEYNVVGSHLSEYNMPIFVHSVDYLRGE